MIYTHKLDPSGPGSPGWTGWESPHKYKGKDTHSYYLWNWQPGTAWALNIWKFGCYDEGLLNGSNFCLDAHYEDLAKESANWKSEMFCTWSTDINAFGGKEPTTTLIATQEDAICPLGTYYADTKLGKGYQWWLCPNWAYLFGGNPPEECYAWFSLEKNFS